MQEQKLTFSFQLYVLILWNSLEQFTLMLLTSQTFYWVLIFHIFKLFHLQLNLDVVLLPTRFKHMIWRPRSPAACIVLTMDILSLVVIPRHLERIYLMFYFSVWMRSLILPYRFSPYSVEIYRTFMRLIHPILKSVCKICEIIASGAIHYKGRSVNDQLRLDRKILYSWRIYMDLTLTVDLCGLSHSKPVFPVFD